MMGGWAAQPADPPKPPVKVTVRGEVAGANREWVLDLGLDPSVLLRNIRWQEGHPPSLLASGKKVIETWLQASSRPQRPAAPTAPPVP